MSLATLMSQIASGEIRVPRFQREFVWERKRIQTLLDSMVKEYPIGTIFLWEAPAEFNHLLRVLDELNQPKIDLSKSYTFILDGQQRLTSLYAVVKGLNIEDENYNKIVVDLAHSDPNKLPFQYRTANNTRWVSIKDLLDAEIFTIYNQLPSDEYKRNFETFRSLLMNYPFSIVKVTGMDMENAIEIFERINRQGRRLSRYDLMTANVLTTNFDLREKTEEDVVEPLSKTFGAISEATIPQALALVIEGKTEYTTQMNLKTEDVQENWEKTVQSFKNAVKFAQNTLGVRRIDFLPYDGILPVLAYYFAYANTDSVISSDHRIKLEQWFWRTIFSERYSGASQTRMTEDAA
ncbi:MAG: DUF262 domain-containing protein [Chloroflexota bacterium]